MANNNAVELQRVTMTIMQDKLLTTKWLPTWLFLCFLVGCPRNSNQNTQIPQARPFQTVNPVKNIDWQYTDAIKTSEYSKLYDLRPEASETLQVRAEYPLFEQLKDLLHDVVEDDFTLCETYAPNTDQYDFILIAPGPLPHHPAVGYYGLSYGSLHKTRNHKSKVSQFRADAPFSKLRLYIEECAVFSIPPNLQNPIDDGTYYFYTFALNGEISQTLCYAPFSDDIPPEILHSYQTLSEQFFKTNRFHTLRQYMLDFVNIRKDTYSP